MLRPFVTIFAKNILPQTDDNEPVKADVWVTPSLLSVYDLRFLQITSLTVELSFVNRRKTLLPTIEKHMRAEVELHHGGLKYRTGRPERRDGLHAVLPLSENVTTLAPAYMDDDRPLPGTLLGLVLDMDDISHPTELPNRRVLILESCGAYYERRGCLEVKHIPCDVNEGPDDVPPMTYINKHGQLLGTVKLTKDLPAWLKAGAVKTITLG